MGARSAAAALRTGCGTWRWLQNTAWPQRAHRSVHGVCLFSSQKERDELYTSFQTALYDVQQKTGFKNLLLEKKLEAAGEDLEKKEAQLSEVLATAQLEPSVVGNVNQHLEGLVEAKDASIRELQSELQRVTGAHNRLLRKLEAKLGEYGVPAEELGFTPIREGSDFSTTAWLAETGGGDTMMLEAGAGAGAGLE